MSKRKLIRDTDEILIVGGTGFIGTHLVKRCLEFTPNITCIGLGERTDERLYSSSVEFLKIDISKRTALESALKGRPYNYVFNLGGYIDHRMYFNGGREVIETHFTGLLNLVECLDRSHLKGFVQVGSSDEYGSCPAPQKETTREMPISPYSLAKTAGTHFVQTISRTEGFPGVALRLFLVYGPGQNPNRFLPQVICACLNNKAFETSEGRQLRDFCYVEDVVEAMVKAATLPSARGRVVNIGSGVPVSIRDMVEKVIEVAGGGDPLWGTFPIRKGENMTLYPDTRLAKELLGWTSATDLHEGLGKTVAYYRSFLNS